VTSRVGYVALEMIHAEVKNLKANPEGLTRYLNSESIPQKKKS